MLSQILQLKVVLIVVDILSTVSYGRTQTSTQCHEPANQQLEYANAMYELYQDPFYANSTLIPSLCSTDGHVEAINSVCVRSGNGHQGGKSILHIRKTKNNKNKSNVCTWKNEQDVDKDRIPNTISKVQCTCRHCYKGICMPTFSLIPVMKKMCDETTQIYSYRKAVYKVPVACECVRAKMAKRLKSRRTRPVMSE